MYQLFGITPRIPGSTLRNPMWNYVRERVGHNLTMITDYYNSNITWVDASHFLNKLISLFGPTDEPRLSSYYQAISNDALRFAHSLQMTSNLSYGKIFNGVFYGPGIREIIVATDDTIDYRHAYSNWRDLRPVTVVSHPFSDLNYPLANGRNLSNTTGLAVINVDIPTLMIQYKAFRDYEKNVYEPGSEHSVMNFIAMHVLPGMLASYVDHALFNRIYNKVMDMPNTTNSFRHPMSLVSMESHVDTYQNEMVKVIMQKKYLIAEMLSTIQLVTAVNASELSRLPNVISNRQTDWAMFSARVRFIELITKVNISTQGKQNRSDMQKVLREITYNRIDKLLLNSMPRDIYNDINRRYEGIVTDIEDHNL